MIFDVDGVMTDGRIRFNGQDEESKTFDVKDGLGVKLVMSHGIDVALISGRESSDVTRRARELGINLLYQGITDKKAVVEQLKRERNLVKEEICCVGDDLPDLMLFQEAGLCIAVADGVKEIREAAHLVTKRGGGRGAVREACEWILRCQGKWQDVLKTHEWG